ncbi:hypothetical protein [Cryobacterium sp. Hz9]|uniref:hypothetical protein n=1 Tax=Cryobacterium sp. Hz9 TaxID=1259167 RepID=UPI00106965AE|nr:hypothetical protein [Cryobacterium sp. Hz9]TFB66854.1 hypothetical protein E3N85_09795 [Cryobacterium sp. Hz9]
MIAAELIAVLISSVLLVGTLILLMWISRSEQRLTTLWLSLNARPISNVIGAVLAALGTGLLFLLGIGFVVVSRPIGWGFVLLGIQATALLLFMIWAGRRPFDEALLQADPHEIKGAQAAGEASAADRPPAP